MRYDYILTFHFLITVFSAYSQEAKITGKVVDLKGKPIAGVFVKCISMLKNNKKRAQSKACVTNAQGTFSISSSYMPRSKYILVFHHISYHEKKLTVNISNHGPFDYRVVLSPKTNLIGKVVVSTKRSLTMPSYLSIKQEHLLIAGGTSVAVMEPQTQRLETLKDALHYEPGVVIQEFFGANDQPRINIRGSGIQSNPQRRGIYLLQDGIPANFADGSFVIGVMDPMQANYIEVLKGANALRYGAATLGGALNFISRNGINSPGLLAKVEGGSNQYGSFSVMRGKVYGKTDAYSSLSYSHQKGFRQHNKNQKISFQTNIGHRLSDNIETRVYANFSRIKFDIPGPLTLKMIKEDPTQINKGVNLPFSMGPDIARDKPGRDVKVLRIANRTAVQFHDNSMLTTALYYQYTDDRFAFPIVISTQRSFAHDFGMNSQWKKQIKQHNITAGWLASYGKMDRRGHINKDGFDSFMFSRNKFSALNITAYLKENYNPIDRLNIIANIQAVYNERNNSDVFPNPELRPWYSHSSHKYRYFYSENISLNQSFHAINPRIGIIYKAGKNKSMQFFGNISSSYEPPTFDELIGTKITHNINTSPKKLFAVKLDKQTAWTVEAGVRHESERYAWNLSLYDSKVKNELLEVKDFVLGVMNVHNYPKTRHKGIELGFSLTPFQKIFSKTQKDNILLKGAYNYSDFYFSSGKYKGNRIAGVPRHFLTAGLQYHYPGKWFSEINIECKPDKTPVDHENTLMQPDYTLYGFKIAYQGLKNFTFYLEGKNIFDLHYASSYIISDEIHPPPIPFPDFTAEDMTFFIPGPTRAFYIGLSYKINSLKKRKDENTKGI